MIRRCLVLALLTCASLIALAQMPSPPKDLPPQWVVLSDPVCPVSGFFQRPFPNTTREFRIMYFPKAEAAKLKDPQSPALQLGFNHPQQRMSVVVSFNRKEDYWQAVVPLEDRHAMYVIFSIKDEKTGEVDDNAGQFWDVVFCDANGTKDINSVMRQAESHTGVSWPLGIRRPKNYDKAVAVLETAMAADEHMYFAVDQLWRYKAERDGGVAMAWAKVSKEVSGFMADRANDRNMPSQVSNFVMEHYDKLPADFVDQTVATIDAKRKDPKSNLRARLEYQRAVVERDPQKRLSALDAFIAKYPETFEAVLAQEDRFLTYAELGDVVGADAAFAKYREGAAKIKLVESNAHYEYMTLARLYIEKGIKLPDALKLIEQAEAWLKSNWVSEGGNIPDGLQKSVDADSAQLRARAYLAMRKPDIAMSEAKKALQLRDSAQGHFTLAQALAASGETKKALDEYFEATLRPSNEDLQYGQELKKFYLRKRFGNERQFEAELQKRKAARFQASNYVPKLVEREAPAFEFVTLKGERFDEAALNGKTLIVNFWSPG